MSWKSMELAGWGRLPRARVEAARPERRGDVARLLAESSPGGLIAHGGGRSYGDAALNDGGRVLLTRRLDRLTALDEATPSLTCEPGVTFADLMAALAPRGLLFPVTPGTAFATIGGAVASDVHGKNHDQFGSFGDHIEAIDLALPAGGTVTVTPASDPALFAATIGGMGLTGVILSIRFRLARIPSRAMQVTRTRIPDLDAFLDAFTRVRAEAPFSVGWIDGMASGSGLGRGILETACFAPADTRVRSRDRATRRVPIDFPGFAMNPASVALFNRAYWRRVPRCGRTGIEPLGAFLYPLDGLADWNRIYGRRGFRQFQCVIPDEAAPRGIRLLVEEASRARASSFLAVLKTLGGEGRGHLSFPMRGFTLALDFPERAETAALLARLEAVTLDHGGRVYLAKDSALSAVGFRRMYPKLDEFRAVLERVDPDGRLASGLSRRLAIRQPRA
jgi:decaprenylphospho-beta-D-ribofuranose 2-oxidase